MRPSSKHYLDLLRAGKIHPHDIPEHPTEEKPISTEIWTNSERITATIIFVLFLVLALWGCDMPQTAPQAPCKADSLQVVLTASRDSSRLWRDLVTVLHIDKDRLNQSLQDLNYAYEAEREQKEKYVARLDSAVRIIRRQEEQLKNSIYNKKP